MLFPVSLHLLSCISSYLWTVHSNDLPLQVDQLALSHLNIVPSGKGVSLLLFVTRQLDVNALRGLFESTQQNMTACM